MEPLPAMTPGPGSRRAGAGVRLCVRQACVHVHVCACGAAVCLPPRSCGGDATPLPVTSLQGAELTFRVGPGQGWAPPVPTRGVVRAPLASAPRSHVQLGSCGRCFLLSPGRWLPAWEGRGGERWARGRPELGRGWWAWAPSPWAGRGRWLVSPAPPPWAGWQGSPGLRPEAPQPGLLPPEWEAYRPHS